MINVDDYDDDPPEFPWLLWIPIVQWTVHGILFAIGLIYVTGLLIVDIPGLAVGAVLWCLILLVPCLALVRNSIRIGTGRSESCAILILLSVIGALFAGRMASDRFQSNTSRIIMISEAMVFLLSAILAWASRPAWQRWKRHRDWKRRQESIATDFD